MKTIKIIFTVVLGMTVLGCSTDSENTVIPPADNDSPQQVATTAIADSNFEQALVDLDIDDVVDGEVRNDRIDDVTSLVVDDKGITNLSGIEGFVQLENLSARNNNLSTVDVSGVPTLKFLWVEDNAIENLNLMGLTILEKVGADRNALTAINVVDNGALQLLNLSENNLASIDVSNNPALTDFTVVGNPLTCILVNQTQLDAIPTDWSKDDEDGYALDCE